MLLLHYEEPEPKCCDQLKDSKALLFFVSTKMLTRQKQEFSDTKTDIHWINEETWQGLLKGTMNVHQKVPLGISWNGVIYILNQILKAYRDYSNVSKISSGKKNLYTAEEALNWKENHTFENNWVCMSNVQLHNGSRWFRWVAKYIRRSWSGIFKRFLKYILKNFKKKKETDPTQMTSLLINAERLSQNCNESFSFQVGNEENYLFS